MDVSLSFFLSFSPFFDNCSSTVIKPQRFLWGDGTGLSPQMYVNVGRRRTVRLGLDTSEENFRERDVPHFNFS